MISAFVYFIGCFGVTVAFNVPMNEVLAGMELTANATRDYWTSTYVPRWTFWNSVRTGAAALSAALLLFGLLWMSEARIVEEMCCADLGERAVPLDAPVGRPPVGKPALVP